MDDYQMLVLRDKAANASMVVTVMSDNPLGELVAAAARDYAKDVSDLLDALSEVKAELRRTKCEMNAEIERLRAITTEAYEWNADQHPPERQRWGGKPT